MSLQTLSSVGCSATTLSFIERGERQPKLELLLKLSLALDSSPTYLATGNGAERLGDRMQSYVLLLLGVKATELDIANAHKRALGQA